MTATSAAMGISAQADPRSRTRMSGSPEVVRTPVDRPLCFPSGGRDPG
jgi:hypothetical protein